MLKVPKPVDGMLSSTCSSVSFATLDNGALDLFTGGGMQHQVNLFVRTNAAGLQPRLLVVATGNISNRDLLALFAENLETLVVALDEARYVEIGPSGLVIHDDKT